MLTRDKYSEQNKNVKKHATTTTTKQQSQVGYKKTELTGSIDRRMAANVRDATVLGNTTCARRIRINAACKQRPTTMRALNGGILMKQSKRRRLKIDMEGLKIKKRI